MEQEESLPKSQYYLIATTFFERFNFYVLQTLIRSHILSRVRHGEKGESIIHHIFLMFIYIFALGGAIIADSWLGKYKTTLYFFIIYAVGNGLLFLSSIIVVEVMMRALFVIGTILVALGAGCIKPCLVGFSGDQFLLPKQETRLYKFFHLFYLGINVGGLLAFLIIALLNRYVHCFEETCYALAGCLTVIAVILFKIGKPTYIIKDPEKNMVLKIFRCVHTAIKLRLTSKGVKKDHWLDFAIEEHGEELVNKLKIVTGLLFLYIPIPLFWGLLLQMATTWVYQARQMNGEIGDAFNISPNQIEIGSAIFVVIFIPLFIYVIYPTCADVCVFRTALRRIALGGFLIWISFVMTAFHALELEDSYPILPSQSEAQIRIFNVLPCNITVNCEALNNGKLINMSKLSLYEETLYNVNGSYKLSYDVFSSCSSIKGELALIEAEAATYYFKDSNKEGVYVNENVRASMGGFINVRTVVNLNGKYDKPINITFVDYYKNVIIEGISSSSLDFVKFSDPGKYTIEFGNSFKTKQKFSLGGVYSLNAIAESPNQFDVKSLLIAQPNSIHILWMIPQYIVISIGEILISITGIAFSYCQTPNNMKTLVLGVWYFTFAIGHLIVAIIEAMRIFEKASARFFLYAAFMVIDMILFIAVTMGYKYAETA